MRLIDADAIIKEIKARNPDDVSYEDAWAITCIEHAPTSEPEPLWTSCAKRLPEVNGDYLVTGRKGAVNKRKFEDGRWYGNWAVIAWKPLPKPWKGETK
jgi:hypothetical protein